jgi:hypothetical protein
MPYVPPHKRSEKSDNKLAEKLAEKNGWVTPRPKKVIVEDFPALCATAPVMKTKMNFANACKTEEPVEKPEDVFKLPEGVILLTKKGIIDGLTADEKKAKEDADMLKQKLQVTQNLYKDSLRISAQNEHRRAWDPNFYDETTYLSYSEESTVETEESSHVDTDLDELEQDI